MKLSDIGKMAEKYWMEIPVHFRFVQLGAFVVMPNHFHGIIIINKTEIRDGDGMVVETPASGAPDSGVSTTTTETCVSTPIITTPGVSTPITESGVSTTRKWKPATLGVIINQFKRMVTLHSRKINSEFAWQSRFYDHIIRDDKSHQNIQSYIQNNPSKWRDDKFCNP